MGCSENISSGRANSRVFFFFLIYGDVSPLVGMDTEQSESYNNEVGVTDRCPKFS